MAVQLVFTVHSSNAGQNLYKFCYGAGPCPRGLKYNAAVFGEKKMQVLTLVGKRRGGYLVDDAVHDDPGEF